MSENKPSAAEPHDKAITAWDELGKAMTAMKAAADALDAALDRTIAAVKKMEPK